MKLSSVIRHSLLFIGGVHTNINNGIAYSVPKQYQLKVLQLIKDIIHTDQYHPDISINKYLGTYDNCDIGQFEICQGKDFINLAEIRNNINRMLNFVLKSKDLLEKIGNTHKIFPKSLSIEEYFNFISVD